MKKSFTLIELLLVVLLMGIVYGLYFFTVAKKDNGDIKLSLTTLKEYLQIKNNLYKKNLSLIYSGDNHIVYLLDDDSNIIEKIDFSSNVQEYILKKKESLEQKVYPQVELDDTFLEPNFIYKAIGNNSYKNLILKDEDGRWYYYNSHFKPNMKSFINEQELITYIKKNDYQPTFAGNIE